MAHLDSGSELGPYRIEGFLAAGGMGEVYAARQALYGTPVALKVLHAHLTADPDWRLRFNEEGLVGQQLKHPNVLAARELVESDGRVALVLDLVRGGQTLSKVIAREFSSGLGLDAALQVFLAILHGVEYAHAKGIVHGDIKPENVLIRGESRVPSSWAPLVTDFGTVGLIAHPVVLEGRAAVVASPRYASPEHLLGVDRLEMRSDVYSLGLLLHFLLTGRHASEARSVEEAAAWMQQPLSLVPLVDQPAAAVELVRRACSPNPAERFPNCREMALAVRAVLDEIGVQPDVEDLESEIATELIEERRPSPPVAPDAASAPLPSLVSGPPRPVAEGVEARPAAAPPERVPGVAWAVGAAAIGLMALVAYFLRNG
jgi:serine/threonine protein kinase